MFDAGAVVLRLSAAGAQEFKRALTEAEKEAQKYADSLGKVGEKTDTAGKAAKDAEPKVKSFKEELKEITKEGTEAAKAADKVGKSLLAVGAASVAATGYAAKSAIDWQTAWAGVQKTNDGTSEQMQRLEKDLRQMTKELPASHAEIAAVAEAAGQLGIEVDNVASFTRAMIDLGETTNLSAQDGAMELAKFMNVMKTSQEQTSNLGSAVVDLGNNYATTERDIVAMASRLAGAGKQVGLTEGEVLGLSTALSSVGIEADAGGSAMSKVMIDIAASVDKGGERLKLFADVAGVSADEFSQKWRTSPGEALAMFVQGLADAESQGKSTLGMLETLGISEVRMRDALLKSASAADIFTKAMVQGEEAFEANTALANEAAIRYETVAAKLDIMWNSINDVAISFGQVLLPVIVGVTNVVQGFNEMLNGMPEPMKAVTTYTALITGAVLLLAGGFLVLLPRIQATKAAFATLRAESPKVASGLSLIGKAAGFLTGVTLALSVFQWASSFFNARVSGDELNQTLKRTGSAIAVIDQVTKKSRYSLQAMKDVLEGGWNEWWADADNSWFGQLFGGGDWGDAKRNIEELDAMMASLVMGGDIKTAGEMFDELTNQLGLSGDEIDRLKDKLPNYTAELEATNRANEEAAAKAGTAADQYLAQKNEVGGLTNKLKSLFDQINEMNGKGQDAVSKNAAYQKSLADMKKEIGGMTKTIDENTVAGSQNANALSDLAKESTAAALAQFELDGNAEQLEKRFQKGRDEVYAFALQLSGSKDAAQALTDKIYSMPEIDSLVNQKIIEDEERYLKGFIERSKKRLEDLKESLRTFTQSYDPKISVAGTGISGFSNGGVIKYFADGGREHHVAQLAKAGSYRVWAEPETGGEAYIPMSPLKRQRSTAILADVANEFGYQLVPNGAQNFANGSTGTGREASAMRIVGELDLGNGLTGIIRGEIEAVNNEEAMNW